MVQLLKPEDELDNLFRRSSPAIVEAVRRVMMSIADDNISAKIIALDDLAERILLMQGIADLLGRRRIILELDAITGQKAPVETSDAVNLRAAHNHPLSYQNALDIVVETERVPRVVFEEAVENIASRDARFAPSAELVSEIYSKENVFALARVRDRANVAITERVQAIVQRAQSEGLLAPRAIELIRREDAQNFSRAYAETVYRTNLNSGYTGGRFQQAQEPDVRAIAPGMRYDATLDADVRRGRKEDAYSAGQSENHKALDGLIMDSRDPAWQIYAPPNGYNCRCTVVMVDRFDLKRLGLINTDGTIKRNRSSLSREWVHPLFRSGRPDIAIYSGQETAAF